ncbi:MAG: toll/interleukin-1 receptor domain-containing protein [Lachnospiraceae bacterium]|nr:toll/interleukin-1 receptor domain-containing protein [Lachnospiraceae bacterium]
MENSRFCAFISYRHQSPDQEIAGKLHTEIENYRIPAAIRKKTGKKRMGRVFRDHEELPLSANLGEDIEKALDESEWLIAVCSPRYLESRWCMREVEYFLQHHSREKVLLLLAEGEPEESFPPQLRFGTDAAGNPVEIEPMAGDVRGDTVKQCLSRLQQEKLRLLAPMLGVSFDDLKRRVRERRIKMVSLAAAGAVVLALGIGLYLSKENARKEALRQEAAEQSRIADEKESRAAEQESLAAERAALAAEQSRLAEEQSRIAEEHSRDAAEQSSRAEEEARAAQEERLAKIYNSIGEWLEAAGAFLSDGERRAAVSAYLEALAISDENDGLRREEILDLMRTACYTEPYVVLSHFGGQNIRFLDIIASPKEDVLLGVANGNTAALIDPVNETIRYQVSVDRMELGKLSFSPDGSRFLAVCDKGRLVTVWNTADGSEVFRYVSEKDQEYEIANAVFWTDSDTILVQDRARFLFVSSDGSEKLIYTMGEQQEDYRPEESIMTMLTGKLPGDLIRVSNDDYEGMAMKVAEDYSRILISGTDGSTGTLVIDPEGRKICSLWGMPGMLTEDYCLTPDGRTAICLSYFGFFAAWDTESGTLLYLYTLDTEEGAAYSKLCVSPDSEKLAFSAGSTLYVMDPRTAGLYLSGTLEETGFIPAMNFNKESSVLFLLNRDLLGIDAVEGTLLMREAADPQAPFSNAVPLSFGLFTTQNNGAASVLAGPSLATVSEEKTFSGTLRERPAPPAVTMALNGEHELTDAFKFSYPGEDYTPALYVSEEGTLAALAYPDGVIELFDTGGDGSVAAIINQLNSKITALEMAKDILAAADQNGRMLLYRTDEEKVLKILNTDTRIGQMAFDESGGFLMALHEDRKTIDVYRLTTAEKLFSLHADEAFTSFGFSADGRWCVGFLSDSCVTGDMLMDEDALREQAIRIRKLGQ